MINMQLPIQFLSITPKNQLQYGLDTGLRQDAHIRNVLNDVKLFESPWCDHDICQEQYFSDNSARLFSSAKRVQV